MQSLPVVIIRCEENEIYQLDLGFRQTTFVALFYYQVYESWSQLRTNLEYCKFKYLKLKELSPPVQS